MFYCLKVSPVAATFDSKQIELRLKKVKQKQQQHDNNIGSEK